MNYLDVYYRALIDYRKNTLNFRECQSQRSATVKANAKSDRVTVVRKICTVKTDWIEAIEEGLVHVDKAIREERQFIRSNGDVVDIEKVRSVSKDSVVHLAQHSNLITRYEEGEDVVPDKLYIVERLNDYAVYENRFLYLLLCYLRDFITIRYNQILDLEYTYNGSMSMNKKIDMQHRHLNVEIKLSEEKKDDPYLKERSESKAVIRRIKDILELVHAFLATPLMEEVAKVAMIKPPITKTNVLRMNHNFRGALALYEYVTAYEGDGYTVTEQVHNLQPFRIDMADEFSEIVLLSSFLTYEYGMNIKNELQLSFEEEEARRAEEQKMRQREQIKALRRRIQESGESPEEYMLMLEKRNRLLEADSDALREAKQEIEELKATIVRMEQERDELKATIEHLHAEMEAMRAAHEAELARVHAEYQEKIEEMTRAHREEREALLTKMAEMEAHYKGVIAEMEEAHRNEIETMQAEHLRIVEEMETTYRTTIEEMEKTHRMTVEQMEYDHRRTVEEMDAYHRRTMDEVQKNHQSAMEDTVQTYKDRIEAVRAECREQLLQMREAEREKNAQLRTLDEHNTELQQALTLTNARLVALRAEHGLMTPADDFTKKETFEELEHQFEVFKGFFKKEWGKTKKAIRKDNFGAYRDSIRQGTDAEFLDELRAEAAQRNAAQASAEDNANDEQE